MAYEFKTTRLIEFSQTDMAGIVHFANFFPMMEATEHAFFRSLGFSIHRPGESGSTGWPRVSVSCDYFRPLRFEDEVEIHLLVAEVRHRSIRYQFTFRKTSESADAARGSIVAVCTVIDPQSGKLTPVLIPEEIRAKIQAAPSEMLGPKPFVQASGGPVTTR
jgi:acyl-CoA thioester hydrolase